MLKVKIESSCVGCGLCEQSCPEVFKVQDDGLAHVVGGAEKCNNLQEVADQCPVNAIIVE